MRSLYLAVLVATAFGAAGCSNNPPISTQQPAKAEAAAPNAQPSSGPQASGKVEVRPEKSKTGQPVTITLELKDNKGRPMPDAEVKAAIIMPMGTMQMREQTDLKFTGQRYEGTITPSMAGKWDVEVIATKEGRQLLALPSQLEVK